MAKKLEPTELWIEALKPDAVIRNGSKSRRSRHHAEKLHTDSNSHRQGGTKSTNGHTKHSEYLSNKSSKRSRDKELGSCGDESMAPLNKRARGSNKSKDKPRYSSKSSNHSSKTARKAQQHNSTSTDKRDRKRHEGTHRANGELRDRVIGEFDTRVITKNSYKESDRNLNVNPKKVCLKSSTSNDPRLIKSGEEDICAPQWTSSPTDDRTHLRDTVTPEFSSNTAYTPVDENIVGSRRQSPNSSNGISDHVDSGSHNDSSGKAGNCDDVLITSPVLASKDLPLERDREAITKEVPSRNKTIEKEIENGAKIRDVNNGEIREDSGGRTSPKVSDLMATKDLSKGFIPKEVPSNLKNSDRLQTFCIGSLSNWLNTGTVKTSRQEDEKHEETTNANGDMRDKLPSPSNAKRGRTPSKDGMKLKKAPTPGGEGKKQNNSSYSGGESAMLDKVLYPSAKRKTQERTPCAGVENKKLEKTPSTNFESEKFENSPCFGGENVATQKRGPSPGAESKVPDRAPFADVKSKKLEKSLPANGGSEKLEEPPGSEGKSVTTQGRGPCPSAESKTPGTAPCPCLESKKVENSPLPNGGSAKCEKSPSSGGESGKLEDVPYPTIESNNSEETPRSSGEGHKLEGILSPISGRENLDKGSCFDVSGNIQIEKTQCPSVDGKKLEKSKRPIGKKRMRTPSLERRKRPQNSPKYYRISTQITSRRDVSRHAPYHQSVHSYNAAGFGRNSQYPPLPTRSTSPSWDSTETYCPSTYLSFGGERKSMPDYGGFNGQ